MSTITIAVAQLGCRLGDVDHNLEVCCEAVERAQVAGADLLVLPECILTGYVFPDREIAANGAIRSTGSDLAAFSDAVGDAGIHAVVGYLERSGKSLYNTAALFGPDGLVGRYRKAHIPPLGVDRFVRRGGSPAPVFETPIGRIGVSICYELRFPESARALALAGADVIAQPANIAVGGPEIVVDLFARVRACENSVFLAVANRCDTEGDYRFCGKSSIVAPDGEFIERAAGGPELIVAEAELELARSKSRVIESDGETFSVELFGDRRPEHYRALTRRQSAPVSVPASVPPNRRATSATARTAEAAR